MQGWGGHGGGLQVGKHGSAEEQGEHSQVREGGGKGFVPSLITGDPQNDPEDLHIGEHNEHKTSKSYTGTNSKKPNFPEVGFATREFENLWDFTEELAQGIALTHGQGKCIGCVQQSIEKGTGPGSCCHVGTSSAAHSQYIFPAPVPWHCPGPVLL